MWRRGAHKHSPFPGSGVPGGREPLSIRRSLAPGCPEVGSLESLSTRRSLNPWCPGALSSSKLAVPWAGSSSALAAPTLRDAWSPGVPQHSPLLGSGVPGGWQSPKSRESFMSLVLRWLMLPGDATREVLGVGVQPRSGRSLLSI